MDIKKKTNRKLLSVLLSVLMIAVLVPSVSFADDTPVSALATDYTVTFAQANDAWPTWHGTTHQSQTQIASEGTIITLPSANDITRAEYQFIGWYELNLNDPIVFQISNCILNHPTNYVAAYNSIVDVLKDAGVSNLISVGAVESTYDTPITLDDALDGDAEKIKTVVTTILTFIGSNESIGSTPNSIVSANPTGKAYAPGASYEVTEDATLVARFDYTYTATFDTDGGSTVSAKTAIHSTNITLPTASDVTKEGYKLVGWNASNATVSENMFSEIRNVLMESTNNYYNINGISAYGLVVKAFTDAGIHEDQAGEAIEDNGNAWTVALSLSAPTCIPYIDTLLTLFQDFASAELVDIDSSYAPGASFSAIRNVTFTAVYEEADEDNPTDPVDPTDPTDSTSPSNPVGSPNPATPTNPTQTGPVVTPQINTTPGNTTPTDSTEATSPTVPTGQTNPTDSASPSNPVGSTNPATPTNPTQTSPVVTPQINATPGTTTTTIRYINNPAVADGTALLTDADTPLADGTGVTGGTQGSDGSTSLGESNIPLTPGKGATNTWSLINLLLAVVLAVIVAANLLGSLATRRHIKALWVIIGGVLAVANVILFAALQDFSGTMVLFDNLTVLYVALFALGVAATIKSSLKSNKEERDAALE
jgi:hypothetical protein